MAERLLRSHFVRRFLDNDLLSPDADRRETLAALSGIVMGGGLFLTLLMSVKFVLQVLQSPARTAVPALNDRFFFFGLSMAVMALAALASWHALSLDARDLAILGPLPIERRTIVRAKLGSLALVASGTCIVVNGVTSLLYPVLLVAKLPLSFGSMGLLILAHAVAAVAAGAFGFVAVLAVRESAHVLLGRAQFARVSGALHAALTVTVIVCVLLLPGLSSGVAERWLVEPSPLRWRLPPLWFVGLHEWLVGDIIMGVPHDPLRGWLGSEEARLAQIYVASQPAFRGLATVALTSLVTAAAAAFPAYWRNNRRFDGAPAVTRRTRRSRFARTAARVVETAIVRHPVAQAGYWLACRSLMRSLPHRVSIATAAAVAIAATFILVPFLAGPTPTPRVALLAPQLVALIAIVLGFRHAIGLPSDLRGNWVFHVAWPGDARQYVAGVRRFGITGLIAPAVLILFPIYAALLGAERAAAHALLGLAIGSVWLQAAMLGGERLPLASAYAPSGTLKTRGPVYLFLGVIAIYGLGRLERLALAGPRETGAFVAIAVLLYLGLAGIARRQAAARNPGEVAPPAGENTQRLGLSD